MVGSAACNDVMRVHKTSLLRVLHHTQGCQHQACWHGMHPQHPLLHLYALVVQRVRSKCATDGALQAALGQMPCSTLRTRPPPLLVYTMRNLLPAATLVQYPYLLTLQDPSLRAVSYDTCLVRFCDQRRPKKRKVQTGRCRT